MEVREITYLAIALRVFSAIVIGGLLGLDRGLKNRPAGLRTYMLVCTGACLLMLTNQYIYQAFNTGDPTRMAAQVISGIGFLGAGTIIVTRRNQIKGLTTAAGLWTSAGVGLALGVGFYEAALIGGFAVFTIITLLQRIDNRMHGKAKRLDIYFELDSTVALSDILKKLQAESIEISNLQRDNENNETGVRCYIAALNLPKGRKHSDLVTQFREYPGVTWVEEL